MSSILEDYSNIFYTSAIAVKELIHLHKTGDINYRCYKTAKDLLTAIKDADIKIKPLEERHLFKYTELETVAGHKDPNDHKGLEFVFNKR